VILAIDQGTSSTKAVLVDEHGAIVARGAAPVGCQFPRPGWVEQDAEEIWQSVLSAAAQCLTGETPSAIAISNQRESALVWTRDGVPAGPMIGWQDSRTRAECERLAADEPFVRARTGLTIDPMFSATKLRWLLDRAPAGDLCAGTVDAWLIYRLTGGEVFACEAGNASRTLLMNLAEPAWDPELLERFDIPANVLPDLRASDAGFGATVAQGPLPAGIPIAAVMADSHAALYGHGAFAPGAGKATYGTGTSVMAVAGEPADTLAWLTDRPTWAFEGNIIASGAALDWMGEILGVGGGKGLEALARAAATAEGVHLVPAFAGLGAPHWDRGATGLIAGLTRGTRREHLARAALEAVAHQVCDVVEALEHRAVRESRRAPEGPESLEVLYADGGATASGLLMQLQADLLGRPVRAGSVAEMSALGAAQMAGAPRALAHEEFRPAIDEDERSRRRAAWREAVARSRSHELEESVR
jgi:glycerol kinase